MRYEYAATIVYVVDGDTVDMRVDQGFRDSRQDRFRLYGIDTPERGSPGWAEATAALRAMLPVGTAVRIVTDHPTKRDPADKYGRWLATIYLPELPPPLANVNARMIEYGHATEYLT